MKCLCNIIGIKYKKLSWAEQPHTINEAGSTYTVQGFDLNYVGVIIGPSVKYRNGRIVFDKDESENKKAKQRRTLKDGSKAGIIQEHPAGNVVMERAIFHVEQPQAVAEHWAEIFDLSIDTEMADKAIAVKTDKHAFVFQLGSENRLQVIEFSTDNEQLKGKNIKIGDGIYSFR